MSEERHPYKNEQAVHVNGFSKERFAAVFLALVARRFLVNGRTPIDASVRMGSDVLEMERLGWGGTRREDNG